CKISHGLACALMLPATLKANYSVRQQEYAEIYRFLYPEQALSAEQAAESLIDEIQKLNDRIQIPRRLSDVGVSPLQIPALVQSSRGNSMSGNPREIPDEELTQILESLL
ncbi:MAG TPA: alcohol dehydrogenase, partial [Planctomycetaceae bacterium]|nr:alcohol dehydrogenase [Planctomycetaceae bacterium]